MNSKLALIPLSNIIGFLIDDLPMMYLQKRPQIDHHFLMSPTEIIRAKIEMVESQIRPNCHDASIIIENYCQLVDGGEYTLKISIFAKQCMLDNKLNVKAPARTLEIEAIMPKGTSKNLDDFQKSKLEQELESEICLKWDTHCAAYRSK